MKQAQQQIQIGKEVTAGLIFGYLAGYASREVRKYAILITGGAFCFLQYLSHKGYISVNWSKIEKDIVEKLDQDGDGKLTTNDAVILLDQNQDGKLDMEDIKIVADTDRDGKITVNDYYTIKKAINKKFPNSAGFITAYIMGIKGKLW
ncbi:hypothetical protein IMG5_203320 [Ichthyophthirius multifiliis]|uniref:EF-hand domain-containing protein n=1 Tax=Ichthyophthirius multifiliis TaxID=5932 RepID=G0R6A8_ICHMU|nr:hypothetical protein IMG5_203320 [Ichthyophthirius multifiliis]EGR26992.1 hypothetical protein IMG5_203320 [Ichthyophthirius multifiliis]|eukprot:XP_004023876.1 hypothetical protein IMG5_203320 [Ichthyophthirius multifiliis]